MGLSDRVQEVHLLASVFFGVAGACLAKGPFTRFLCGAAVFFGAWLMSAMPATLQL